MVKYVILLYFYVVLLQKHKKHTNRRSNKIKNEFSKTLAGFQTRGIELKFWSTFKSHVSNLNFNQTINR